MIAAQIGFPAALKIDSPDISHKSDVQGVMLDVQNAIQVRDRHQEMLDAVKRAQPDLARQRQSQAPGRCRRDAAPLRRLAAATGRDGRQRRSRRWTHRKDVVIGGPDLSRIARITAAHSGQLG